MPPSLTRSVTPLALAAAFVPNAGADSAPAADTAAAVRDRLVTAMDALRASVDAAERITDESYWPLPSYGRILFSV